MPYKIFFKAVVLASCLSLLYAPIASAASIVSVKPLSVGDNSQWVDDSGNHVVIAGLTPLVLNYELDGGSEDATITSLSIKISNQAFLPAISGINFFYDNKNTFLHNKKVYNDSRVLRIVPDPDPNPPVVEKYLPGTVKTISTVPANGIFNLTGLSIYVPHNASTTIAARLLMKNDGGAIPSGTQTAIGLLTDPAALTLTAAFQGKTASGRTIEGEMVSVPNSAPPSFVFRYSSATVHGASALIQDDLSTDPNQKTIAKFYFSADLAIWENPVKPKPTLSAIQVQLTGNGIGQGIGDNNVVVSVFTANPDPSLRKLGEITLTSVDNGTSAIGELTLPRTLPLDNGSQLLWFTVDPKDDDFISSDQTKTIGLNIVGYTWSDGEVSGLTRKMVSNDVAVPLVDNRPKIMASAKLQRVNGALQTMLSASVSSQEPVNDVEIYFGTQPRKQGMAMVKQCQSTDPTQASLQCSANVSSRSGYYYAKVNGGSAEGSLNYFNL